MKAILLMFDSLNRHFLPPYGGPDWIHAPNFRRLAERSARFERAYIGSAPCMPARRELHTARPEFLHRPWGPLEPFDDSMPEKLKKAGTYTHLVTDHYHYWEDLGANYHNRFNTYEFFRGLEGDPWIGQVAEPGIPANANGKGRRQDWVNRPFIADEAQHPLARTIGAGCDFLRRNAGQDNWFLNIECFCPHEPYFVPQRYRDLYPHDYRGPLFDWPPYQAVNESPDLVAHGRYQYAAALSMADAYLGNVLDLMDELDLWKDTLLIVNTDHGFMLGEHDCWAKNWQPWYEELSHVPLFIWDPRCRAAGVTRQSFVQTIDLPVTLLDYFGVAAGKDMLGQSLRDTIATDAPARAAGLFGNFGRHVNVTDGRYVYMRGPVTSEAFAYTLAPERLRIQPAHGPQLVLAPPFNFTKGFPVLRIPQPGAKELPTLLFDLATDPKQERPLNAVALEQKMIALLMEQMRACDAPAEQYARLGLPSA